MFPYKIEDRALQEATLNSFSEGPIHRSIDDLGHKNIRQEVLVQVTSAKVVHANYNLLQHDFPQLEDEAIRLRNPAATGTTQEMIDEWLIKNVAYISKPQAIQQNVNTEIAQTTYKNPGYRPGTYGRAIIYSIEDTNQSIHDGNVPEIEQNDKGLLDVKGVGISPGAKPSFREHANGLLSLGDAFIEYLNQLMIQGIFTNEKTDFHTLPVYAIIDLGFDIKHSDGGIIGPAALVVRRAHTRPENTGGLPKYGSKQQLVQLEVEQLIRKYGITSANYITGISVWRENGNVRVSYGGHNMTHLTKDQLKNIEQVSHLQNKKLDFDGLNVQHTGEYDHQPSLCHLVDFGSYRTRPVFRNPLLSLVSDRLMRWGGSVFPGMKEFVQADEQLRVPLEHWGKVGDLFGFEASFRDTKMDIICEGLAKAYGTGKYTAVETMEMLDAYLQTATINWKEEMVNKFGERFRVVEKVEV